MIETFAHRLAQKLISLSTKNTVTKDDIAVVSYGIECLLNLCIPFFFFSDIFLFYASHFGYGLLFNFILVFTKSYRRFPCKIPYTLSAIQHHLWTVFLMVADTTHSSRLIY